MDKKRNNGSRVDKYRNIRKKKRQAFHGKRVNEQGVLNNIEDNNEGNDGFVSIH